MPAGAAVSTMTHPDTINNGSAPEQVAVAKSNDTERPSLTKKIDWLLALTDDNTVVTDLKEQNSDSLEALGDIVTDGDKSTPMDDVDTSEKDSKGKDSVDYYGADDKQQDDQNTDTEETTPEDDVNNDLDQTDGNEDENIEEDPTSDGDNSLDLDTSDNSSDDTSDQGVNLDVDNSKDPHLTQNRRILISNKLMRLYDDIKNSIDIIVNGPSFENKPVTVERLESLAENVTSINDTVNKVSDHKVLLMKYAVCVRTFVSIIGK